MAPRTTRDRIMMLKPSSRCTCVPRSGGSRRAVSNRPSRIAAEQPAWYRRAPATGLLRLHESRGAKRQTCFRQWTEKTEDTSLWKLFKAEATKLREEECWRAALLACGTKQRTIQRVVCRGVLMAAYDRNRSHLERLEQPGIGKGRCSTTFREKATFGGLNRGT